MGQQRFEIKPGARVAGHDGDLGRVGGIVVNPGTGEVQWLVGRKGLLFKKDFLIPAEAIERADEDEVRVRLDKESVKLLPEFRESDFSAPPPTWHYPHGRTPEGLLFRRPGTSDFRSMQPGRTGLTDGGKPLKSGMRVACRDREVGRLELVLVDPETRKVGYFVVKRGSLLGRETIIPVEWVRDVTEERITLNAVSEQLDELPEYRPDGEITVDVLEALWFHSFLKPHDLDGITVRTHDGIVELSGYVDTDQVRDKIEGVARGVRGVIAVRNRIQSREALGKLGATAVSQGTDLSRSQGSQPDVGRAA